MDRLEVEAVGVLEGELGGVLDDADSLGGVEQVGERAQERRLAGAGLAGHEDVRLGPHEAGEEVRHLGAQAALGDPIATVGAPRREVEPQAVELADREVRPADRRQDGVDAGAVGHPRVDDRVRDRQLPPGEGGDPLGDLDELCVRGEPHAGRLRAARPARRTPRRSR